jgi:predicted Zn-dependent peptidase
MRGIAVSCPCDDSSYVAVSFSVGLDEPNRVSASTIAHLAEHVVATLTCAASPEQETALGILRSTGISHNASTSAYETCFFAAGTTDDLERTWIPMLGAAIASPNLGARCVETERSAALDEMYAVRASCAVTDGKLDTYVASVEAPGSWQTRVDDDIAYLERESTERVAAAIGAFIAEYYCSARMHVTVASADADRLLSAVRRFVLPRPSGHREDRKPVLPRAVYKWTNWDPGSVSVIEGSAGDTTRVRFCASVNVSSDPVSVLAASCAAWCVAQTLFVELRVRSNAVYSVHAALDLRAVTNEERDGDHDAAIVVSTVCTHDKAPLVMRCIRDAFDVTPELVADWARSRAVRVGLEPRDPVTLGERAREVSVAATHDAVTRADRLALIESVTHADVVRATSAEYRVYASTSDAPPRALQRAIERALGGSRSSRASRLDRASRALRASRPARSSRPARPARASRPASKNKKKQKQRSKRSAKKKLK